MFINRNLLCIQISFLLILFCFDKGYGQTINITGSVYNVSGQRVPFSSIAFYKKDTLIKGTIADSSGNYRLSIDKGNFILKASALNAEQVKDVNLTKDTVIHIILPDSAKLLNEVTIKGVKPAIEYQIDRTVFNVQNTLFKTGLSGIQLLKQAPRLEMSTDQTIKMIGRDAVRVMINGRLLNLSESAIIAKLASLRSDNILKVEIIPNPPSKFSAEGNVGYINIVLKKDETNGFQFRPFFEYTQRRYASDKFGADINYRSPKISLSISPYYEKMRVLNSNKTLYCIFRGKFTSVPR